MNARGKLTQLLALLLAASTLLNVALLYSLRDSFEKLHFARIFPLGFVDRVEPGGPNPTSMSIAIYGDSRAQLWRGTNLPKDYEVINLGHGGQTSRQLLLQLQHTPPLRTRWSVVQIGINDLHPLKALPRERDYVLTSLPQTLETIVRTLKSRSDYVIVTTILPPSPPPWSRRLLWDDAILQYIEAANSAIRQIGQRENAIVIDAHAALSDGNSYLRPEFADRDFFLHINQAGYSQLERLLLEVLAQTSPRSP